MSSNPQHQKINTHSSTSKATPHPNSIKNGKQQPAASTAASETSAPVIFSTSKKIRKAWNQFEIKLIKAADASKVDARKIKENPNAASAQSRIVDVRTKCLDLMQARDDLRKLLHEAEADVKTGKIGENRHTYQECVTARL